MSRYFPAAFAVLFLSACASLSTPPASTNGYRLEGRISVRTSEQGFSGGIVWQSVGARQDILLRTPLGQGVAEVHVDETGASMTDSAGQQYRAATGDELVQQAIGAALPMAGLAHWLRGRPDPARPFTGQSDGHGGWGGLEQDGWLIEYRQTFEASGLPKLLIARRNDLEIRLVVDTWQTP